MCVFMFTIVSLMLNNGVNDHVHHVSLFSFISPLEMLVIVTSSSKDLRLVYLVFI